MAGCPTGAFSESRRRLIQLQSGDLGNTQAAAARQADDDQVAFHVGRAPDPRCQVGEHGGQFAAGEQTSRIEIPG